MSDSEQALNDAAILFVKERGIDIRWRLEPEGKEADLRECFKHNNYLESLVRDMILDAAKFIKEEKLQFPVYIVNTIGSTLDDCGIGFGYPTDKDLERKINMQSKARDIKKFADDLPENERESYLQKFREAGWGEYL